MATARTWLEYQENYARYGFDMRPRDAAAERAARKKVVKEKVEAKRRALVARTRGRVLFVTIIAGAMLLSLIVSTAYAAAVRYDINRTVKENDTLRGEIENLTVKIKSASSISRIEAKALNELGMVYPTSDQYVYLGEQTVPRDMSEFLVENVYVSEDSEEAALAQQNAEIAAGAIMATVSAEDTEEGGQSYAEEPSESGEGAAIFSAEQGEGLRD